MCGAVSTSGKGLCFHSNGDGCTGDCDGVTDHLGVV